ncbi:MAG: helix-turn-helix transcriptional regulator [Oscillatoria sp. SIO1A7]|nr:helix-turn-helix transcriptional regulator [Oscillatoria sp. SIO1A7]
MKPTFGTVIAQARDSKGYSQTQLAKFLKVSPTYMSKLEKDRTNYAPKEGFIRLLAQQIDLDEEELIVLAGRLPQKYEAFLKQNYKDVSTLFRRLEENPDFAEKVFKLSKSGNEGKTTIAFEIDTETYNIILSTLLSEAMFDEDCIGRWAKPVIWEDAGGWLIQDMYAENTENINAKEAEAIFAWRNGEELPEGYFRFDWEAAEKVIHISIKNIGISFAYAGFFSEKEDLDKALQEAILGKVLYT